MLPGSTINGATVQRQQLLRPFPEFGTISAEEYRSDRYHAATVQIEKRFRGLNSLTAQHTWSSLRDTLNYLNPQDGVLEDRVSPNDRPHRFSGAATFLLPFGRGQKWGSGWNGLVDAIAGGWQVSGTYQHPERRAAFTTTSTYFDAACDLGGLTSSIGRRRATRFPAGHARMGCVVLLLP